jgi:hypothetical protein
MNTKRYALVAGTAVAAAMLLPQAAGAAEAPAEPVTVVCQHNDYNGLVALDCQPWDTATQGIPISGEVLECQGLAPATDPGVATALGVLGVPAQDAGEWVGFNCTPAPPAAPAPAP